MKREAELKSLFTKEMKWQLPGFVMLHFASRAAPDRSITGLGRTTHWEFKHGTPDFHSPGDQELMCRRLEASGHCKYVIWQEGRNGESRRTLIVSPRQVANRTGWSFSPDAFCIGYNIKWLVDRIREAHV